MVLFGVLLFPTNSFADRYGGHSILWFNAHTFVGYGNAKATGDRTVPTVGTTTLGAEIGFRIARKFLIGASADYRFVTQFSAYDPLVGNRRGSNTTLGSPILGWEFNGMALKAMLHISGNYKIQNTTQSGQSLSYSKASGFRIEFTLPWGTWLKPTAFYESVSYSNQMLDGVATGNPVPLALNQYGIGVLLGL
ncbi:MAG: hypothetical protein AABZ55_00930 [Bdellovibrionota bacterium]